MNNLKKFRTLLPVVFLFWMGQGLYAQCFISYSNPNNIEFIQGGETIDVDVFGLSGGCSLTIQSYPSSWLTAYTLSNSKIRLVASANTGPYVTGTVQLQSSGNSYNISVAQVQGPTYPANPANPTIATVGCGQTTLQKPSSTDGSVLYWQGKNEYGTSTSNTSATYTANQGDGYYYVRARKNNNWSTESGRVYVTINDVPSNPVVANQYFCGDGGTVTFSVSGPESGVTYKWYNANTNAYIGSGTSITTPSMNATTPYDVVGEASNGCESSSVEVLAINTAADMYTEGLQAACGQSQGTLKANSFPPSNYSYTTVTHKWYTAASGGTALYTYPSPTFGNGTHTSQRTVQEGDANTTFWVSATYDGCESNRYQVQAQFIDNSEPTIQILGGDSPQCGPTAMFSLNAIGGATGTIYEWYDGSNALLHTGANYSPTVSQIGNTTFYLRGTAKNNAGCTFPISESVTVTLKTTPSAPNVTGLPICGPGSVSLAASGVPGAVYKWYDSSGQYLTSGASYSDSIIGNTVYKVTATVDGCESDQTSFTAVVNPVPSNATDPGTNDPICGSGTITLTATPGTNGNTIRWYDAPTGGTLIDTDVNLTTGVTGTTSFYVTTFNTLTECESTQRIEIVAVVNPIPDAPTATNGSRCGTGPMELTATLGINGTILRWYDSSSGGTQLGTGDTFTIGNLTESTLYHVESYNETTGCSSPRVPVEANISETMWYSDTQDGDGLGDPNDVLVQCDQPIGYVSNSNDVCPSIYSVSNDCTAPLSSSDPQDHNYLYTRTYQLGSSTVIDPQRFVQNDNLIQEIAFFDGLGRPFQKVAIAQSPNEDKNDIVTHIAFDEYGRQVKEWLPYADLDPLVDLGSFRPDAESETDTYYETAYGNEMLSGSPNPFSEKDFESSPLNRVLKQAAPGEDWMLGSGHEIQFTYATNTDADDVRQFEVDLTTTGNTYEPILMEVSTNLEYSVGELYKNITYDENHPGTATKDHTVEEFKDKQGRVVLKRTYNNEQAHDTYYVYDDFGNLSYVLTPKMDASSATLATLQGQLDELGYQYVYDQRNRLVEKKLPGKGWEHIIYNKLDQPIMTQDSVQRGADEWLFTKYDAFGRVAYTGKATDSRNRETIQANSVDVLSTDLWVTKQGTDRNSEFTDTVTIYYNNGAYPTSSITEVLTINYYDDYNFDRTNESSVPTTVFDADVTTNVQGLATGSKIKVLEEDDWITTVSRYDDKGRAIYAYSFNEYLGTTDIVETDLDFVGKPITVRSAHTRNSATIVTIDNFEYDHAGRLLKQTQCIGNENLGYDCQGAINETGLVLENETVNTDQEDSFSITVKPVTTIEPNGNSTTLSIDPSLGGNAVAQELIAYNHYDNLGQLVQKKVGGVPDANYSTTTGLQTVDYSYTIRGWLKQINDPGNLGTDLFAFGINYNTVDHNGTALFNGNIAETEWQTANTDNAQKWYTYAYDPLNRITGATDSMGLYGLSNVSYDRNGNILTLQRAGHLGTMDNLVYNYHNSENSNRLQRVADSASGSEGFVDGATNTTEYTYDGNGNMITDANKQISGITYNHLNLPTNIVTSSGNISYVYDATGTKLEKVAYGTGYSTTTEYAGNFVYSNNGAGPNLEFLSQPEGYVTPNGLNGYDYVYQYKDHLGNIRLSYVDNNGTLEIVEENNYYPFGLKHKGYNDNGISSLGNDVAQKWKFGGKEYDDSFDINTYDFDARNYDPALGRWMNIDPLAEQMRRHSPYNYAFNDPMRFVDPDGMSPDDVIIKGKEKQAAFKELQSSVSTELTLAMDKNGKVTYTQNGTGKLSKDAQQLVNAIDDNSIVVNVNAENTKTTKAGDLYIGGAFSGNTVSKGTTGNTVVAEQEVNPIVLGKASTGNAKPGADMLHEVTEAYQGALISQKSGVSSPAANKSGTVYTKAHKKATSQSGPIYETLYDGAGNILPMTPSGTYPTGVKKVEWSVKNKGKTTIIQTLK